MEPSVFALQQNLLLPASQFTDNLEHNYLDWDQFEDEYLSIDPMAGLKYSQMIRSPDARPSSPELKRNDIQPGSVTVDARGSSRYQNITSSMVLTFDDSISLGQIFQASTTSQSSLNVPLNWSLRPSLTSSPLALDYQKPTSLCATPEPDKRDFPCQKCAKSFNKQYELNRHMKHHNRPISCPLIGCNKRMATNRCRDRHIMAQHPESAEAQPLFLLESPHICPIADCKSGQRKFRRKDNLVRHLKEAHDISKRGARINRMMEPKLKRSDD